MGTRDPDRGIKRAGVEVHCHTENVPWSLGRRRSSLRKSARQCANHQQGHPDDDQAQSRTHMFTPLKPSASRFFTRFKHR